MTGEDVRQASRRIGGSVVRTPMVHSAWLSDLIDGEVWLKLETVQTTGSFKMRGALNALTALRERDPSARAVTTASAGNHGLALATAAAQLGFHARVHVPAHAPQTKRRALTRIGAEVVPAATYDDAERAAQEDRGRGAVTFVSAYSDSDVIAGAGTAALEMLGDQPDLDTLVVPVGGGGLISGTALIAKDISPSIEVVGAEAGASPVFTAALAAGHPVIVDVSDTLADGLAGNMEHDSQTFGIVRDLVTRVDCVSEAEIAAAMRSLIFEDRVVAEGASAVAVAAVVKDRARFAGRRVGIIVSGRNVDAATIERVVCGKPGH